MIHGRYNTSEMAKILKKNTEEIKKYREQGLPNQVNDSGVVSYELVSAVTWLDENTEGYEREKN